MRILILCLLLSLTFVNSSAQVKNYTYSATAFGYSNGSMGAQFTKTGWPYKVEAGIGITTFFNKGAIGKDYTGFYNTNSATSVVTNYRESIYALVSLNGIGLRLGLSSKKRYYNGQTSGERWYVVTDAGTYALYGISIKSKNQYRIAYSAAWDNINGYGIGLSYNFNEHK